ncbi:hypothetical protein N0K08_11800 [Acidovorax sp. Be4]|uniref:Glycosyltransferase n=1 Tax=Acidovorax bellezanensis TaxID=2976702 RepID=A0ABT2PM70_9BURK|nr:hypothetical protein [Acidovorax sp. Be4]MCT9811323.1 hypothetical protein [Acidovorax sp. Be4]
MKIPTVHAMYWDNIPSSILSKQREVFAHLDIPLQQERADQQPHGLWMNEVLERLAPEDIVVICDIDAFPLSHAAYLAAVQHAQEGALFGLAQFSNHKQGTQVYAGPMFMAFRKSMWMQLGSPTMRSSKVNDAAEIMSVLAREAGIPVVMPAVSACLLPKWSLGNEGVFGIGTFYGKNDFFHLFESRKPAYEAIFHAVADDVLADKPLNFRHYLEIVEQLQAAESGQPPRRRSWWKRLWK